MERERASAKGQPRQRLSPPAPTKSARNPPQNPSGACTKTSTTRPQCSQSHSAVVKTPAHDRERSPCRSCMLAKTQRTCGCGVRGACGGGWHLAGPCHLVGRRPAAASRGTGQARRSAGLSFSSGWKVRHQRDDRPCLTDPRASSLWLRKG